MKIGEKLNLGNLVGIIRWRIKVLKNRSLSDFLVEFQHENRKTNFRSNCKEV